jgi:hypothetical protein
LWHRGSFVQPSITNLADRDHVEGNTPALISATW